MFDFRELRVTADTEGDMGWRIPIETTPHERTWMAFPRSGPTLGSGETGSAEAYATWSAVAHAIAEFEPVTMVVDPSEETRARSMLGSGIDQITAPLDEFWMRDTGPTFVVDDDNPRALGAIDWTFNGWGDKEWARWRLSADTARFVAAQAGAQRIPSLLVNEGGGIACDGMGTVIATETVQLDPRRNPYTTKDRVEAEFARTLGATHVIWLPRGLARDTQDFGTNGHVDIVAAIPAPGQLLVHQQRNPEHPDFEITRQLRAFLDESVDASGSRWHITDVPAPSTLRDREGFVDWSYINHLVVNGGVVACGFGDERADAVATEIMQSAYPGRQIRMIDARPIFDRGGGIHCITQQQPAVAVSRENGEIS